jgi:hypothetical protein
MPAQYASSEGVTQVFGWNCNESPIDAEEAASNAQQVIIRRLVTPGRGSRPITLRMRRIFRSIE